MPVITVEHLAKSYGDTVAVADVSFTVQAGEIFGILGPNGAGKTTTVECICGLRDADHGTLDVLGLDPKTDAGQLRHRVGVQLQEARLPDRITVVEALRLFASFYEDPASAEELLTALGLDAVATTRFGNLSGGQQQRVSIALALVGRPEVVVLDELTTGLDPRARRDTWALIEQVRDRGVTVLLVTHLMEEAERLCDRIVIIDRGRVVAHGTPAELADANDVVQRLRFRSSKTVDPAILECLPSVRTVERRGTQFAVTGDADVLGDVVAALAEAGARAEGLRVDRGNLEDAFVTLTDKEIA